MPAMAGHGDVPGAPLSAAALTALGRLTVWTNALDPAGTGVSEASSWPLTR